MNNKIRSLLPAVLLTTYIFSSCSSTDGTKDLSFNNNIVTYNASLQNEVPQIEVSQNTVTQNTVSQNTDTQNAVSQNAITQNAVTQSNNKVTFVTQTADIFSAINSQNDEGSENNNTDIYNYPLSGLTGNYLFATGAGGWKTELRIEENGSYSAFYTDGNYASDGNDGTVYTITYCSFNGWFGDIRSVDEHTVTMTLRALSCNADQSFEYNTEYESGSKAYYRELPYGFEDYDTITIYRKGTKTGDLPQTCLEWLAMSLSWGRNIPATIDRDVLYNAKVQSTFIKTEEQ